MPSTTFDRMPDDARLWVFAAERPLDDDEARALLDRVDGFLADWKAHGHPLTAARDWREDRFLLVAVDERTAPPSGCSIDAMVRVLSALEDELEVGLIGHGPVFWRDREGDVRRDERLEFQRRVRSGEVDLDTPVFDPTLTRVRQARAGELERPARDAWHRRAFWRGLEAPAPKASG
jgi:hypothetical protein